ncbi:unnamed protein product [Scytosiphon promiscuus]
MRRSWFEGKKCLDVGCNEGFLTLALVRSFRPRRMVGVDIDSYLVRLARRALLAEMNAASDAGETKAFRPLMPRSLRGGGPRASPCQLSTAADACASVKRAEEGNRTAKRPRNEKDDASAGGEASRKKGTFGRRKTDKSDTGEGSLSTAPPDVVITHGMGGGADSGDAECLRRVKLERLGDSLDDVATDINGRSSDDATAAAAADPADPAAVAAPAAATAAAAAVAAGALAALAPAADDDGDAKVLSGCAVSFRCEDFVAEDHGDRGYDVVCLFSIVKWIHINGGDDVLREVFRKAYSLLQRGGRLILEPQPWKSYRKSARQHGSAEAREIVGKIKLRPSDFPALLTDEVGFRSWEEVGLPSEGVGGFAKRSVHVFVK